MKNFPYQLRNALNNGRYKYNSADVVYVGVYYDFDILQVFSSKFVNELPTKCLIMVAQFTDIGCYLRSYNSSISINIAFTWL